MLRIKKAEAVMITALSGAKQIAKRIDRARVHGPGGARRFRCGAAAKRRSCKRTWWICTDF